MSSLKRQIISRSIDISIQHLVPLCLSFGTVRNLKEFVISTLQPLLFFILLCEVNVYKIFPNQNIIERNTVAEIYFCIW